MSWGLLARRRVLLWIWCCKRLRRRVRAAQVRLVPLSPSTLRELKVGSRREVVLEAEARLLLVGGCRDGDGNRDRRGGPGPTMSSMGGGVGRVGCGREGEGRQVGQLEGSLFAAKGFVDTAGAPASAYGRMVATCGRVVATRRLAVVEVGVCSVGGGVAHAQLVPVAGQMRIYGGSGLGSGRCRRRNLERTECEREQGASAGYLGSPKPAAAE